MRRKKIIINALIMTFSTIIFGFVSMFFRVYLSKKIGPEGMGLYQLIMSVYFMAITFSSAGIRIAITRLVAEQVGRGNKKAIKSIVNKGCIYSLFFSVLTALVLFYGAQHIGVNLLKDERAITSLKILACSLPFISVSSCLSGYFYGAREVIKSVSAEIIEQLIMMGIVIVSINLFIDSNIEKVCVLICIGMAAGNIISCIYAYLLCTFNLKTLSRTVSCTSYNDCKILDITKIALPIASSSYIQSGLRTIEDILIPSALRMSGTSLSTSLSIFGMIKGMALPIINFPAVFLSSFATLIIPEIAEAHSLNRSKIVNFIISNVFRITFIISIFASGIFIVFSNDIGMMVYNNKEIGIIIRVLAPIIPIMYLERIMDGILNSLNKQVTLLKINLVDMVIRILIIYFIIPTRGIEGFIIVIFTSNILNFILNIINVLKVTKLEFKVFNWVIKPIICITIAAMLISYTSMSIVSKIMISMVIYFGLLIVTRCIRIKDINWIVDSFRLVKDINVNSIKLYNDRYL
ncbi:MAG: oligosaccharide flippase family protein [Peptostreptococcaceae bacterium]